MRQQLLDVLFRACIEVVDAKYLVIEVQQPLT
jgi:hypothetical protein